MNNIQTAKLSVIVITKNEEDRIARCLQSVTDIADEIIVFDSGSTDGTVDVVKQFTSKVFITDWPGYGIQKQRALDCAAGEWVLSIDADEEVSHDLRQEIRAVVDGNGEHSAYRLPWQVVFYGKRIRYGRSARSPLRLFKRQYSSFTSSIVHEKVIVSEGTAGKLRGYLYHYSHRDFGHALQKFASYAWLNAKRKEASRQKRRGIIYSFLYSVYVFFVIYIVRRGFLDGAVGFILAALFSQYTFNKYVGLWLIHRDLDGSKH